jgi:hypothetical protein
LDGDCAAPNPPYDCEAPNEALALLAGAVEALPKPEGAPNPEFGCCWLLELLDPKGGFGVPVPPPKPIIIYSLNLQVVRHALGRSPLKLNVNGFSKIPWSRATMKFGDLVPLLASVWICART